MMLRAVIDPSARLTHLDNMILKGNIINLPLISTECALGRPMTHCRVNLSGLEVGGYLTRCARIAALIALNDKSSVTQPVSYLCRYRAAGPAEIFLQNLVFVIRGLHYKITLISGLVAKRHCLVYF